MKKIEFRYGKETLSLDFSGFNLKNSPEVLLPHSYTGTLSEKAILQNALANPVDSEALCQLVKGKKRVVILISDVTRPCPSYKLLPFVLEELAKGGVRDENITVVCGLGSHRTHTKEEQKHLVGEEVYNRITVLDSDVNNAVAVGTTPAGTPLEVFRPVAESDFIICTGNIDYHYFAGYSGGCKAVVPGVCTRNTIQHNHSMMLLPGACTGNADGNPVRSDMEEIINFLPVNFIFNVVLSETKAIIGAYAGDAIKAHREGCAFLDSMFKIPIGKQADIVIASAGGFPKDINIYQAQKALDNSSRAVKDGGTLILIGNCSEGYGEATFEQWLKEAHKPEDLTARIQKEFRLGGHKAAAIARVVSRIRVFFVTELPEEMVARLYMERFTSLEDAFTMALNTADDEPSVICIPFAGATLPDVKDNGDR